MICEERRRPRLLLCITGCRCSSLLKSFLPPLRDVVSNSHCPNLLVLHSHHFSSDAVFPMMQLCTPWRSGRDLRTFMNCSLQQQDVFLICISPSVVPSHSELTFFFKLCIHKNIQSATMYLVKPLFLFFFFCPIWHLHRQFHPLNTALAEEKRTQLFFSFLIIIPSSLQVRQHGGAVSCARLPVLLLASIYHQSSGRTSISMHGSAFIHLGASEREKRLACMLASSGR